MTMATRIVVMKDGLIQQVDTPQTLYDKPVNIFVAGFIGTPQMNFITGVLSKKGDDVFFTFEEKYTIKLADNKEKLEALNDYIGKEVVLGIRPENLSEGEEAVAKYADSTLDAYVDVTELMGAEIYLYLNIGESKLVSRVSSRSKSTAGQTIKLAFDTSRVHIFDKDTERFIVHFGD
jgi:multiple sugar transport system ATP-binding protein